MFLHAGWLHLLGNLFYLYLTAPFIEDVWGRPVFAVFYLVSGVVAAVLYSAQYPHLSVPLIGASGAVAGIMGAFMVRYARTRITFVYFAWFIRVFAGTFQAPAMIMLLLWVGGELLSAYLADWMAPGSGGSGVAHWAHVWGFGFGALGAVLVGALKLEEKHRRRTAGDDLENTVVEHAHQAAAEGRRAEAWGLLAEEVRRHPSNRDAALALWDLGMTLERTGEAAPAFARVIRDELGEGEADLALFHWRELSERAPDFVADPGLRLKLAETLWRTGDREEAEELVRRTAADLDGETGAGIVLRLARLGAEIAPALGAEVARAALERTSPPPEMRLELEELGAASPSTAQPPGEPRRVEPRTVEPQMAEPWTAEPLAVVPPAPLDDGGFGAGLGGAPDLGETPSPPPAPWKLRVLEGKPRELTGEVLALDMAGGQTARLRLASLRALAAAVVREEGARRPYLVLDLFLDAPDSPAATTRGLRVVRCLSRGFDPRKLLASGGLQRGVEGDGDIKRAFQELIDRLLAASGATPLLASDRFGRRPMKVYPSMASYQAALSG
jgi:membrane associated rhomboid family serine protease